MLKSYIHVAAIASSFFMVSGECLAQPAEIIGGLSPAEVARACSESDTACKATLGTYLTDLRKENLDNSQQDEAIANIVIALTNIVQDKQSCGSIDLRIAQAISFTGSFSSNADQKQLINDISRSVELCEPQIRVAALGVQASAN